MAERSHGARIRQFVVVILEWLCAQVDALPNWMYPAVGWLGCCGFKGGLAGWSIRLDERWKTGWWA